LNTGKKRSGYFELGKSGSVAACKGGVKPYQDNQKGVLSATVPKEKGREQSEGGGSASTAFRKEVVGKTNK